LTLPRAAANLKEITIRKFTICALLCCCTTAAPVLGAKPKLLAEISLRNNDTLVFVGDSITRQCLYTQYVEDFYYTRYPKRRIRFYNAGVGGDRAADVLARFDEDVAPLQPRYVTVLLGMNDGSYEQYSPATFRTYEKDMTSLIKKITALDARPIVITPTMFDVRAYRSIIAGGFHDDRKRSPYYNSTLASYGAWLREQAFERGLGFVDMYGPLNRLTVQQRKSNPDFTLTIEGIHPNPAGHLVMAYALLRDMNASDTVSAIHLLQEAGTWRVKTTAGKATQLQTADSISFTFLADSLPWIVPDEALPGYRLVDAGSTLSRETLRVSGLPPGRYQLCIDDSTIGDFNHLELACGIQLQQNVNTPQYQQARQVAQLNKQRNEKAVYVLRDQWTQLKDRRQQGQPENEPFEQWFASFTESVAELHKSIQEYEDRIYQANQPIARKYQIRKITP
jgi:lysophospholipase L1-like esterase